MKMTIGGRYNWKGQPGPWQPIDTAPRETELLVGRWVNDDWRICQSGFYFDAGNEREGEPAYWYWHCDWDNGGVTDSEGPTHWMPLPAPPQRWNSPACAAFRGGPVE